MQGSRVYLTSGSVAHEDLPMQKGNQRVDSPFSFNYFEPTPEGTGVRNVYVCKISAKQLQSQLQSPARANSIANLTKLLEQRRDFEVNTAYLVKASEAERADNISDKIASTDNQLLLGHASSNSDLKTDTEPAEQTKTDSTTETKKEEKEQEEESEQFLDAQEEKVPVDDEEPEKTALSGT
jgi:hypothetical protein